MGQCDYKTYGEWLKEEFENYVSSHMNDGKRQFVVLL